MPVGSEKPRDDEAMRRLGFWIAHVADEKTRLREWDNDEQVETPGRDLHNLWHAWENCRRALSSQRAGEPTPEQIERAIRGVKAVQHAAIGAAPDGDGYAWYFYERVENGHGYGAETHPPIKGASVNPGVPGVSYAEILARAALDAAHGGDDA